MSARRPIAPLPPALVERIAAGEAIERPAAAIKELIENALDAGASEIAIEATGGGLALLRVADNGHGIPAAELELACQRHATSKAASSDDLERISTLGFRGEALASLVAAADLTVIAAADDAGAAWQVSYVDGALAHAGPAARRRGTTVAVRRLFAALPARRKFMEHAGAEAARIAQVVRRYATVHPAAQFSLIHDGRNVVRTSGSGEVGVAVGECWGRQLQAALLALPCEERTGFRLAGWLGDRSATRASRNGVVLAVNGRPVEVAALRDAFEAAYRPLLPRGRHPFAVILLTCDPADLDVNVHPAKAEVLLRRQGEITAALARAVHAALAAAPAQAAAVAWTPGLSQGSVPPAAAAGAPRLRERRPPYGSPEERLAEGRRLVAALPAMRLLGQVQERLILVEGERGLYLVDQHRAHERLLYEKLTAEGGPAPAQALLEPLVLELKPEQAERFAGRLEQLAALGFRVERLHALTYLVHTLPAVEGAAAALTPPEPADELWREALLPGDHWLDRLRTSVACRSAIRRGQPLPEPVMRELLFHLAALAAPTVCPHGSPLILEVTSDLLARQFDWG